MEDINSTGDGLLLLVMDELCLGRTNTDFLDTFYSAGSECTFNRILQLGLSLYLVDKATVWFRHFLFAPVPDVTNNRLLFRM